MSNLRTKLRRSLALAGAVSASLSERELAIASLPTFGGESQRREWALLAFYYASVLGQILLAVGVFDKNRNLQIGDVLSSYGVSWGQGLETTQARRDAAILIAARNCASFQDLVLEDSEATFDFCCETLSLITVAEYAKDPVLDELVGVAQQNFLVSVGRLSEVERMRVSRSLWSLYGACGFYSWQLSGDRSFFEKYRPIFELTNSMGEREMSHEVSGLESLLSRSRADRNIQGSVCSLLNDIQYLVKEGLDIFEALSSGVDNLPWRVKEILNGRELMIIPRLGRDSDGCSEILLAICHSSAKKKKQRSPKEVMTQVQQAIIKCRGTLKAVVFLCDPIVLGLEVEEHLPVIQDFIAARDFDVFVPVTLVGNRLNAVAWS